MCRHAGYVGPAVSLAGFAAELPHSLLHQSYQARELLVGTVCADGYGLSWWRDEVPGRYVFPGPIWSDTNLQSMGQAVRSHLILGAVRNATVAGQNIASNCAPFQLDDVAFSHNGFLDNVEAWLPWLQERANGKPVGNTDSEWLLHCLKAYRESEDLPHAMLSLCRDVLQEAKTSGREAQINFLAGDGQRLYGTRAGSHGRQNTLYHLQDGDEFPGGHVLASEPLYDDPLWAPVADNTLMIVSEGAPPVRLTI